MESTTGNSYKRSRVCVCGSRKFKGTPFCVSCWENTSEEFRLELRPTTGDAYDLVFDRIVLSLRERDLISPISAAPVYMAKASVELPPFPPGPRMLSSIEEVVVELRVNRTQMERLFLGAAIEDQAAALNYLLENDRVGARL